MSSLPSTGILGGSLGLPTDGILGGSLLPALAVGAIDIDTLPDDGGVQVTLTGVFPVDEDILVNVTDNDRIDRSCFSGALGQGPRCRSLDGDTLIFISPPLPVSVPTLASTGRYDLVLIPTLGPALVVPEALLSVHRTFAANLFSLRSVAARPRYVGPYTIEDED